MSLNESLAETNYWTDFPATYRAEAVQTIAGWTKAGESGLVIGGSGTGKSNLAGFLGNRPEVVRATLGPEASPSHFLLLDINQLPLLTVAFFYRGLIQLLQEQAASLGPELAQEMQALSRGPVNWDDLFEVLALLQKAHRLLIHRAGHRVIWLLDRFDEAYRHFDPQVLNSLRSLRDQFKGRLSYVVFTRLPLTRLRPAGEVDEFQEIFAANRCWVGPMVERDGRWVIRQMADRLQTSFDRGQANRLLEVSGGLPAFLKLACLAVPQEKLTTGQSSQSWAKSLLARPEFLHNCAEIWHDLSAAEQAVLTALASGTPENQLDPASLAYLQNLGLLTRPKPGAALTIFSPLLTLYLLQQQGSGGGVLKMHPKSREILRDGLPLEIELTQHEERLLAYFLAHPAEVCEKYALMQAVWPDEQVYEGISDERLAQLIKRLRWKIEPDPRHPAYIQTVRGRGYRFVQPKA